MDTTWHLRFTPLLSGHWRACLRWQEETGQIRKTGWPFLFCGGGGERCGALAGAEAGGPRDVFV